MHIANALAYNGTLEELSVRNNSIRDIFVVKLLQALVGGRGESNKEHPVDEEGDFGNGPHDLGGEGHGEGKDNVANEFKDEEDREERKRRKMTSDEQVMAHHAHKSALQSLDISRNLIGTASQWQNTCAVSSHRCVAHEVE